jgi:hypothetical protein
VRIAHRSERNHRAVDEREEHDAADLIRERAGAARGGHGRSVDRSGECGATSGDNRRVSLVVWVQAWQPGDHRRSYVVGDAVSWSVSEAVEQDWTWLGEIIGLETTRQVTHVFDSYSRPARHCSGRIASIRAMTVTYSDGERGGSPIPGSGTLTSVQVAPRLLPDHDGSEVLGYLVNLDIEG